MVDAEKQIAMVVFTFDSSKNLCDACLNPAIAISQRVMESYVLGNKTAAVP